MIKYLLSNPVRLINAIIFLAFLCFSFVNSLASSVKFTVFYYIYHYSSRNTEAPNITPKYYAFLLLLKFNVQYLYTFLVKLLAEIFSFISFAVMLNPFVTT
jgi:hypothetical protein